MARIQCFMMEPTGRVQVYLRRYHVSRTPDGLSCPLPRGYHNASTPILVEQEERDSDGYICNGIKPLPPHDDPRWPAHCACGYAFAEQDEWQRDTDSLFRRADTGEEFTLRDAPTGAMWYASWLDSYYVPQGPHVLEAKTPGGVWTIDGQARNCAIPDDRRQERHHCWVLRGTPPYVTAGNDGGPTCHAGAGSIQCGAYHGFLRDGWLESC